MSDLPRGHLSDSDNSRPVERGQNFNWELEALHYQKESDKLRELLHKVESSSDVTHHAWVDAQTYANKLEAERDRLHVALKEALNHLGWSTAQVNLVNRDNCVKKAIAVINEALEAK